MKKLLEPHENGNVNYTKSLEVSYVANSHLLIATTNNEEADYFYHYKNVLLMKAKI